MMRSWYERDGSTRCGDIRCIQTKVKLDTMAKTHTEFRGRSKGAVEGTNNSSGTHPIDSVTHRKDNFTLGMIISSQSSYFLHSSCCARSRIGSQYARRLIKFLCKESPFLLSIPYNCLHIDRQHRFGIACKLGSLVAIGKHWSVVNLITTAFRGLAGQ